MKEEMIDVLDEKGNYVKSLSRSYVHQNGLWHKSVHIWVLNTNGELLLQKRSKNKKFFPGVWDCAFAGHIEAGETSIETVVREGKEELGIDINLNNLKHLMTNKEELYHDNIFNREFVDVYVYEDNIDINLLKIQKEEVSDVKWMVAEEFFKNIYKKNSEFLYYHEKEYNCLDKYIKNKYIFI